MLKIHHAAIDGQEGAALLTAVHGTSPEKITPAEDTWQPEPRPTDRSLLRRAAVHSVTRPVEMTRLIASNAVPILKEVPERLRSRDRREGVPSTPFNKTVSAHRVWDHVSCDLDAVKQIRKLVDGATLNDVSLAIVAESMRTYLIAKGELPDEALVSMVPVSTRTPDQAGQGGNQISMMRPSLHTDIDDPIDRLAAITATTKSKKAAQSGVIAPLLLDMAQQLPGALVGLATRAVAARPGAPIVANTIVTNVPGSRVPLYFLGAQMVKTTGCVPLTDGIGIFHCVTSYCDTFAFMYTACRVALPDADFYTECLANAIDTYVTAARSTTVG